MSIPTPSFRSLSAEQVEELWKRMKSYSEERERLMERCLTSDREGIRMLHIKAYDQAFHEKQASDTMRFMLLEVSTPGRVK